MPRYKRRIRHRNPYRPTDFDPVVHSTDDPNVEYDVTYCSQGTISRWGFMLEVSRRWRGPMSIVYYFPKENESSFLKLKAESNLRPNIIVDYVVQTDPFYFPINTLRNRAIDNVKTTHFWLTDMDVWPSFGSYDAIMNLPREFFADPKNAGIVPVFQMRRRRCRTFQECIDFFKSTLPDTKAELATCRQQKRCETFRPGQRLHDYYFKEWYDTNYTAPLTPLICFYGETQEPYVVVKKVPGMPRFDERFANYAFNKVEWLEHLRYRGYMFWVITDAFGYDIPHPSSKFKKDFFVEMKRTHKFPMKDVYRQYLKELRYNYSDLSVIPFCRGKNRPPLSDQK